MPGRSSPAARAVPRSKLEAMRGAGIHIAESPAAIGKAMVEAMGG